MRKLRVVPIAAVTALLLVGAKPAYGFLSDMAGHWSGPLVGALQALGVVDGNEQGRFNPDASLTRAELAKLLVTGLGYQNEAATLSRIPSRFTDIPSWHWAKGFVESLAELAAMEGYPDGRFAPEESVTRAQLAAVLVRVAGGADQARSLRFEPTGYADDQDVPDWARGSVHVARRLGLMEGFENGTFRPTQPVTRAEASVAVFRVLGLKGTTFHLTGTLVRFDVATGTGVLLDEMGSERTFTMGPAAEYFRTGLPATVGQIRPLDQVWVVQGADGRGVFLDARFADMLAYDLSLTGLSLSVRTGANTPRHLTVQGGAMVYVNGRPAQLQAVDGATHAYLLLDRQTNEVRAVDAVFISLAGKYAGMDLEQNRLHIESEGQFHLLPFAKDLRMLLNGQLAVLGDLRPDDRVMVVRDTAGVITYMLVER